MDDVFGFAVSLVVVIVACAAIFSGGRKKLVQR
jgi:hypothetical protein